MTNISFIKFYFLITLYLSKDLNLPSGYLKCVKVPHEEKANKGKK